MVMNAEERLYGMMAVVEEQQKVLSTSLAEFKKVTEELRTQKNELSKTVDSVSQKLARPYRVASFRTLVHLKKPLTMK